LQKARTSGHDVASFNVGFQTGDEIELLTQNKAVSEYRIGIKSKYKSFSFTLFL
jgi:hypothetical protein